MENTNWYTKISDEDIKAVQDIADQLRNKLHEIGAHLIHNRLTGSIFIAPNEVETFYEGVPEGMTGLDDGEFFGIQLDIDMIDTGYADEGVAAPETQNNIQ